MKRIIVLILALSLFVLIGCGDDNLLYKDNTYIIRNSENGVSIEITASYVPSVHDIAKDEIDINTMPCLTVLKYSDDKLTVSSSNYDGDAKDEFELWELDTAENLTFKSITVIDDNGDLSVENIVLPKEEHKYIGEYYTYGYFEFNDAAEVATVIFYGENIIQG